MVRAHHLRRNGRSQSQSAKILGVSRATVNADLKLLDAEWTNIAELTHDDLLLDQIEQLNLRLKHLLSLGPTDLIQQLGLPKDMPVSLSEMTRLYAVHQQSIQATTRELRLLLRELRPETRQRSSEIVDIELADDPQDQLLDQPHDQLAVAQQPEHNWPQLNKPEHPERSIPRKTREILHEHPNPNNSAEHLTAPLPRNTGRSKPCPCGSGRKRKHCHPQSRPPPRAGPALDSSSGGERIPADWTETQRLTQLHIEAKRANDPMSQLDALDKLAEHYGMFPDVSPRRAVGAQPSVP